MERGFCDLTIRWWWKDLLTEERGFCDLVAPGNAPRNSLVTKARVRMLHRGIKLLQIILNSILHICSVYKVPNILVKVVDTISKELVQTSRNPIWVYWILSLCRKFEFVGRVCEKQMASLKYGMRHFSGAAVLGKCEVADGARTEKYKYHANWDK